MNDPFAYSFEDAFHGPLGEYARRNQVRVEIDRLSLLLQLLTVNSVAIGRRAFAYGGPDRHFPNLFTLIVGCTAVGKGGSGTVANKFGEAIDPGFRQRTAYNVASGPALVQLVSDGLTKTKKRKTKDSHREEIEVVREPVQDKRLLLFLPEFGSTLTAQKRDGSTLRDELKNAWDGRTIENNKYNCRERATDPHIGMIGHITPVELKIGSTRADVGNGYLNRFLITVARTSLTLPFHVPEPDCSDLLDHLRGVLERLGPVNQNARCLDWAEDARDEWAMFYRACRDGRHPFIADILELAGRLPAEVMRVALNYAVLDEAPAIQLQHLRAAKAVCLKALDRTRHLFTGKPTGNPDSDLVQKLRTVFAGRKDSWKSTDIHKETGSRLSAHTLAKAAANLVASGEWCVTEGKAGNGHPAKFWSWAIDAEANVEDTPTVSPPEEEIEEPMPVGTVTFEEVQLRQGEPTCSPNDLAASLNQDNTVTNEEPVNNEAAATIEAPADAQLEDTLYADFDVGDDTCEVRVIDGMEVECFSPFVITENRTAALRIGGGLSEGVRKGDHGFRIRSSRRSASDERSRVGRRLAREDYLAVVIGDRPLHLKRAFLRFETTAPTAA